MRWFCNICCNWSGGQNAQLWPDLLLACPTYGGGGPFRSPQVYIAILQENRTTVWCARSIYVPPLLQTNKQIEHPNTTTPLLPSNSKQLIHKHGHAEPVLVNLLRSPGIDSQPGPVRQPYLSCRSTMTKQLAEWIPRNRFLGSVNVYKYGLWSFW
jgi:hypothetical protein